MAMAMVLTVSYLIACLPIAVHSDISDLAAPDMIKFGIESKHSSPLTSTEGFKAVVIQTLRELKHLCTVELEALETASKL
jgi:hypothetical protein